MSSFSIRFTQEEIVFVNKVLDHYRLFIIKHLHGVGKVDHANVKKKVIIAVYESQNPTIEFTTRELKFLKNLLFQHFIGSLKANIIKEELPFLSIYLRISQIIKEPANEILLKLKSE